MAWTKQEIEVMKCNQSAQPPTALEVIKYNMAIPGYQRCLEAHRDYLGLTWPTRQPIPMPEASNDQEQAPT